MTDKTQMNAICKKCGKQLSADEKDVQYCSRCMIEQAEEYVPEAPERLPIKRQQRSKTWLVVQLAIILAAVVVMALQIPRFISAVKGERPLRQGTYATDAQADQCIANLWRIARLVQEGKAPGKDIVCPISKKSYVIRDTGKDVVISCPNPELHGFKAMQISKRRPVPEISK
jgi:ferredoxin-thioredoxin reductase catalytic subunit